MVKDDEDDREYDTDDDDDYDDDDDDEDEGDDDDIVTLNFIAILNQAAAIFLQTFEKQI